MRPALRLLVAESEPPDEQRRRRESVGRTAGETYGALLKRLAADSTVLTVEPLKRGGDSAEIADFDAVFLTGSPLHLRHETDQNRPMIEFMRAVFEAGVPSFGSCAGLQIATVAAGGSVRRMPDRKEAGFGRHIVKTLEGARHPLLEGRPSSFDAPSIHSDEVERLPAGSVILAQSQTTEVQAAEIRCRNGVFWGVQYHPELTLHEVAEALRRQSDDLVEAGLASTTDDVALYADEIDGLDRNPEDRALSWRLGLDRQVLDADQRAAEVRNFIMHAVRPR